MIKLGVYFEDGINYAIKADDEVKITIFKVKADIQIQNCTNKSNISNYIQRIDKYRYVDKRTGEIKEYSFKQSNAKETKNIKRSMKKAKLYLENNFNGENNELFITLTTGNTIESVELLNEHFDKFWDELKVMFIGLEYFYTIEYKDSCGLHIHGLFKDTQHKRLYISNEEIEKLWGIGYTQTKRIKGGIDKVIKYITKDETKEGIKGGKRLYYHSRGIKLPEECKGIYAEVIQDIAQDYELEQEHTVLIKSQKSDCIVNRIKKENWTRVRRSNNEQQ